MKFQQPALLELPKFKTALEYRDRLTFGIANLDSILALHLSDMIGIFGGTRYTNALATRLVVRSLLPRNHGGIDTENEIAIDADNSSSSYLYVDIGRQYGCIIQTYYKRFWLADSLSINKSINKLRLKSRRKIVPTKSQK